MLRDWLEIQRDRLSDTDAEGPLVLAGLYEEMLADRVTAVELLRKAWRIDPNSKEIAEAFRSRGFRKVQNEWVESAQSATGMRPRMPRKKHGRCRPVAGVTGLTPEEVRLRLGGKPDRVSYLGSRAVDRAVDLSLTRKRVRYVNLLHSPGDLKPRVVADYTLPVRK